MVTVKDSFFVVTLMDFLFIATMIDLDDESTDRSKSGLSVTHKTSHRIFEKLDDVESLSVFDDYGNYVIYMKPPT